MYLMTHIEITIILCYKFYPLPVNETPRIELSRTIIIEFILKQKCSSRYNLLDYIVKWPATFFSFLYRKNLTPFKKVVYVCCIAGEVRRLGGEMFV